MIAALAFLTIAGPARTPSPAALCWFPPAGALIGGALGALWWGSGQLWPVLVAATLVVAADAAITGMLHLDGLADTADGLLPPVERARRLAIMAAPDVGAFGVTAVVLALLLRTGALASTVPEPLLLAGLWCLARSVMAAALVTVPDARLAAVGGARPEAASLASPWRPGTDTQRRAALGSAAAGVVAGTGATVVAVGTPGLAAVAAALAGAGLVLAGARRRIGGVTGDVLGAAGVVAETVGLVVAVARW
jgi:adenosylcobinamide-GDP ribazoletransferase